jgi:hypothetical protein
MVPPSSGQLRQPLVANLSGHDYNFEPTVEILPVQINGQYWFSKETKCHSSTLYK